MGSEALAPVAPSLAPSKYIVCLFVCVFVSVRLNLYCGLLELVSL